MLFTHETENKGLLDEGLSHCSVILIIIKQLYTLKQQQICFFPLAFVYCQVKPFSADLGFHKQFKSTKFCRAVPQMDPPRVGPELAGPASAWVVLMFCLTQQTIVLITG